MKRYVVGLMFSNNDSHVVLIRKNRPTWQAGKLNGVGGHIEEGESPIEAMVREFREETGVTTTAEQWWPTVYLTGVGFEIYFFESHDTTAAVLAESRTDEGIELWNVFDAIQSNDLLPNLRWIIPFSIDPCAMTPLTVTDAPSTNSDNYTKDRVHV